MKQKMKLIILAVIIIVAIVIIVIFARGKRNDTPNTEVQEDGTIVSTSEKLKETKKYEGFEISNIKVVTNENLTTISGDVKNVKNNEVNSQYIGINAYNGSGEVIATFQAIVAPPGDLQGKIAPGDTITFNASITEKLTDIYDVEFVAPNQTEVVVPTDNEKPAEDTNNKK